MRSKFVLVNLVLVLVLAACSVPIQTETPTAVELVATIAPSPIPTQEPPFEMTFMAGYKPQANLPFVGAYIAKEKGFFANQNLDVTIEHSPGKGEHLQLLVAGKVQVTTMDAANVIQRRADAQVPAVSIALIGQKGQQAFAALKKTGFTTPADWKGKNIGFKGVPTTDLLALLESNGLKPEDVNLVNVGFDPRVLTEGQVDVYPVYKSNEPFMMQGWGEEVQLWDASDYGVPTLGLAYASSEQMIADHPAELAKFLRAVLDGIRYAEQNPEEAIDIVMKYAGPETNRELMKYMLETELVDAKSDHGYGFQSLDQWQALADSLTKYAAVENQIDVSKAFNTSIWEDATDLK